MSVDVTRGWKELIYILGVLIYYINKGILNDKDGVVQRLSLSFTSTN